MRQCMLLPILYVSVIDKSQNELSLMDTSSLPLRYHQETPLTTSWVKVLVIFWTGLFKTLSIFSGHSRDIISNLASSLVKRWQKQEMLPMANEQ